MKWKVCCKWALCSGYICNCEHPEILDQGTNCLNCTPNFTAALVLWECIEPVRRMPGLLVSWSPQLPAHPALWSCPTGGVFLLYPSPSLPAAPATSAISISVSFPDTMALHENQGRCATCESQECYSSFGLLLISACAWAFKPAQISCSSEAWRYAGSSSFSSVDWRACSRVWRNSVGGSFHTHIHLTIVPIQLLHLKHIPHNQMILTDIWQHMKLFMSFINVAIDYYFPITVYMLL